MDYHKEVQRRFLLQKEYLGTDKAVNKIEPVVSVTVSAYQHENYIRQCLDGILMQETSFPYEVIVGEDDSKDNTRAVCIEYAEKYPDKIRLFLRDRELSHLLDENGKLVKRLNGVLGFSRMSARGRYIAMCEGDDYWTDPLKLQKQFETLEENSKINICSHPSRKIVDEELTNETNGYWGDKKKIIPFEDVLMNLASTAPLQTMFFRNQNLNEFQDLAYRALGGHSMSQIFYSYENGLIYLPDVMSVYRVNSSSSISKVLFTHKKTYYKNMMRNIDALLFLKTKIKHKYSNHVDKRIRINAMSMISSGLVSKRNRLFLIKEYKLYLRPLRLTKVLLISAKKK